MSITAVIPVREGSRRLKNKNIAPFAGTNLLINKINQLKQVDEITDIVVSSDSDLMLAMASSQGVKTHKRAPEFCEEKTKTFGEVVAHICESVPGNDMHWSRDMILWFQWKSLNGICAMIMVPSIMN